MRQIDTSPITSSAGFPIKKGTIDFLQNNTLETLDALSRTIVGNDYSPTSTSLYFLYGSYTLSLIVGTTYSFVLTASAFFYQGEIFLCSGASLSFDSSIQHLDFTIVSQPDPSVDPVTMKGSGATENMHINSIIQFTIIPSAGTNKLPIDSLFEVKNPATAYYTLAYQDDSVQPLTFRKKYGARSVQLKGIISAISPTNVSTNSVVLQMPSGFRPSITKIFPIFDIANNVIQYGQIDTSGNFSIRGDKKTSHNDQVYVDYTFDLI